MNYQKENPMSEVNAILQRYKEFFIAVDSSLMQSINTVEAWVKEDIDLHNVLLNSQTNIDNALKDNFDTPKVMHALINLISATNTYISAGSTKRYLLKKIAAYVTKILKVFGIINQDQIGFPSSDSNSSSDRKEILLPFLKNLTDFRSSIRNLAKSNAPNYEYLNLCDDIRDNKMPELGVRISDDGNFPFEFVDREYLLQEKRKKLKETYTTSLTSLRSRYNNKSTELQQALYSRLSTQDYMKILGILLLDNGDLPEKDTTGKKIGKSQVKKLQKSKNSFPSLVEKYQKILDNNPNYIIDLQNEVQFIEIEIKNVEMAIKDLS